ncbi:ATP-binding cassette domain-containing protein [Streptomyces boncukensis]|uniref:ATP-binding cassette domain-containing protein n=1 Tax=Streptomyces boncukensis TaxID=2711219 RepID=A0A6G4X0U1_9ACTN|nr:ATP-binding cassette domain-containing protein [Streptomyces boncukensis]NGO70281.1 ATP-binding cassette domain-containing protein [Streptomyces boncukensis]
MSDMAALRVEDGRPRSTGTAASVRAGVKSYRRGGKEVRALNHVTVPFPAGAVTAVMGPSGSGKSTLLRCAAGLEQLTTGDVYIGDTELGELDDRERALLRRDRVGFIFHVPGLSPAVSAADGMLLPQYLAGTRGGRPGGRPGIVFVDEPADRPARAGSSEAQELLLDTAAGGCRTIVVVTHAPGVAARAEQAVFLDEGRVAGVCRQPSENLIRERLADLARRPRTHPAPGAQ